MPFEINISAIFLKNVVSQLSKFPRAVVPNIGVMTPPSSQDKSKNTFFHTFL